MTNNDTLRRIRFILDANDMDLVEIFALGDCTTSREEIRAWLKRDDDAGFAECSDENLCAFLNGVISWKRGKKEGTPQAKEEDPLTNNAILRKLKIAFEMQTTDMLEVFEAGDFPISKHELNALFRRDTHKNYRECRDQMLRNFLKGLQVKHRPDRL